MAFPGDENVGAPDLRSQRLFDFSSVILADTEDVWGDFFRRAGAQYQEPKLVIYRSQVRSGCGLADSGMGPFFCRPMKRYIST